MAPPPPSDTHAIYHGQPQAFYPFLLPPPWYHQWGHPFPPAVPPVQIVINFNVYGGVQHFNSGSLQPASESSCCQETNDNRNEECRNSNERVMDNMMKGSDCTADTAGCNNSSEEGDENKHEYSSDIVEDKSCDTHDNANNQEVLNSKRKGFTTGMQNEETKRSKKDTTSYSSTGFSTSLSSVVKETTGVGDRVIARSRKWLSSCQQWSPWILHKMQKNETIDNNSLTFNMNRGGVIQFFPTIVSNIHAVQMEMLSVKQFRQYKVRECAKEPRLHALFSSNDPDEGGYKYGRVTMESHPLNSLPVISKVADNLASRFHTENNVWNIGCHLVVYRDGKDSINWHADDTQGEDLVVSLTVESPADARTICFQPANNVPLQEGDEQIELFPLAGDAYSMDGVVQHGYVHAMLKMRHGIDGRRMAIIFRNGLKRPCQDNGIDVETIEAPPARVEMYKFGSLDDLVEGNCYS